MLVRPGVGQLRSTETLTARSRESRVGSLARARHRIVLTIPCYHPACMAHWWDFGNGRLGDMGCHMIDLPFWALDLKYPLTVEAKGRP